MQVDTSFERPIGASADVAELEYISALAQTDKTVREDASLRDSDIALFLSSRYGIKLSEEEVRETILQGLTTTRNNNGGDYLDLDLMEIVSILFIPVLLKAVADARNDDIPENLQLPPPGMLSGVLCMMLEDVTG